MKMPQIEKLTTGIEKLDASLENGIPKNHLILITGTAGTMKSSLAFQFAYANVVQGKSAMYITLEQNAVSIITQMMLMNFNFDKIRVNSNNPEVSSILSSGAKDKKGLLTILDIGYIRAQQGLNKKFSWLKAIKTQLAKHSKTGMADIVILDSLTALYHMEDFKDTRIELFHIFEYLKSLNASSFIINEMPPGDDRYSQYGVESYLVDGVILLSQKERKFMLNRELSIVKMRYVNHARNVFVLKFDNGAFKLLQKLEKDEGE